MPQQYCAQTVPMAEALVLTNTGDGTKTVTIIRDIPLPWQTAALETVSAAGQVQCVVLPGNSHTIDAYHHTWLIVVYVGCAGQPTQVALVDQKDQGGIDSLLTDAGITTSGWAILGKIVTDEILDWHQIETQLPAGVRGDILYFDGSAWVRLAIGNTSDVLTVAEATPGVRLPAWSSGVFGSPLLVVSDTSTLGYDLWNGSGNNAAPSGWSDRAFDDSAWPAALINEPTGSPPTPMRGIWCDPVEFSAHGRAIFRRHFTLGIGAITSAKFPTVAGAVLSLYINGTNVYTSSDSTNGTDTPTSGGPIIVDPLLLVPGEDNVFAGEWVNAVDGADPFFYYSFVTNTA